MGEKARQELLSSLKELYANPEYSDLTIKSSARSYHVHKAIVCLRSKFLSSECRNPESEAAVSGVLELLEEDPRAMDMLIQFLYHLDYPCVAPDTPRVNGYRINSRNETNGIGPTNGADTHPDIPDSPEEEVKAPSVGSQEDRDLNLKSTLVKPPKSKKKKRKKPGVVIQDTVPEEQVVAEQLEAEVEVEPDVDDAAVVESPVTVNYEGNLLTHAKVYSLSQKFGIPGLKELSLEKFQTEAEIGWESVDFLEAAQEVYRAPADGEYDRKMRDAVTSIVCQHLELLDKEENQAAIKPLELSHDVLIRMRKEKLL